MKKRASNHPLPGSAHVPGAVSGVPGGKSGLPSPIPDTRDVPCHKNGSAHPDLLNGIIDCRGKPLVRPKGRLFNFKKFSFRPSDFQPPTRSRKGIHEHDENTH